MHKIFNVKFRAAPETLDDIIVYHSRDEDEKYFSMCKHRAIATIWLCNGQVAQFAKNLVNYCNQTDLKPQYYVIL